MKILIATNNLSKYKSIKKILTIILKEDLEIDCLDKYKDFKEIEEVGNNIERAKGKAVNAIKQIKGYDYYLGIDDGVILNNQEYAAVRDHMYDIIVGDKIKIGEIIYITRAYYLIDKNNKEKYVYNKVPYVLRTKLKDFEAKGYPLNSVISTVENEKPLVELTEEERSIYLLKYVKDELVSLFN